MIKWLLVILGLALMIGCTKTQPTPSDEQVTFTFNFYQKGNAKMVCIADQHPDTVTLSTYTKSITKTARKSIYVHSDIQMNMTGQLIYTSSTSDSIWVSISVNGKLIQTSAKAGKNDYYYETAQADYSW